MTLRHERRFLRYRTRGKNPAKLFISRTARVVRFHNAPIIGENNKSARQENPADSAEFRWRSLEANREGKHKVHTLKEVRKIAHVTSFPIFAFRFFVFSKQ